jgi:hypothetical protein
MEAIRRMEFVSANNRDLPIFRIGVLDRGVVAYRYDDKEELVVDVKHKISYTYDLGKNVIKGDIVQLNKNSDLLKNATKEFNNFFKREKSSVCCTM